MNDLDYLINLYVDELASDDEVSRLNELLRADAKARRVFSEHLNLESALAEMAMGLSGKEAAEKDMMVLNRHALFSNTVAYSLITTAAAVILVLGGWWWQGSEQRTANSESSIASDGPLVRSGSNQNISIGESTSVALLLDEAGATFADGRGPNGKRFVSGEYELMAGVAHLKFALGTEMILSGPAQFTLLDSMHVRMEYGKIRVIAPPSAKGFSILTPDAEYIDLGTEFGLDVDREVKASDLYVFDGQVNVSQKDSKQLIDEVHEGGSKRHSMGVSESAPKMQSTDFPTPNQIGFVRWQNHTERILKDPGLIAFFPFRRVANESVLSNQVNGSNGIPASVPNGQIVGARWVSGRWPGKDSLLFDGDNELVQLYVPGEYEELTIAVWLKIDRLDYEMNAILNSDGFEDGDVHFQITRQGLPKGGVQGGVTKDTIIGDPLPIGTWNHVAMVISLPDHNRRVYANGKLVRYGDMDREVSIRPGMCRLGNWLPAASYFEKRTRAFRGKIDEMAIWNRALTEREL
ncbi:MAG TPA: LamG-like jellyroll fold domain-containing protein, partial [Pirellula sp.]|nr:LamG-like jellyroll fold domain-containing protein [Pirellula sp.]